MNTKTRPSLERGHFDFGWLKTFHSFSFGEYRDPKHMGFRSLRVINEDHVAAGGGFPTHPHRDMEIITYVITGALAHKDSMGHVEEIRPGDVQRMTAGSGLTHSEFNPSKTESTHLLQIWIRPSARGLEPGYEQTTFADHHKHNRLCLIGSQTGRDGSVVIHQDVDLYASQLDADASVRHQTTPERGVWLQAIRGTVDVDQGPTLGAGDGAAIESTSEVVIKARESAEFLLFDLA